MSPSEPPVSIYGTMPRGGPKLSRVHRTDSPLSSHYATFRKEKLGPRVSLKLMQMMAEGREEDTRSILSLEQGQQGVSFNRMAIPAREALEDRETEVRNDSMDLHGVWGGAWRGLTTLKLFGLLNSLTLSQHILFKWPG